MVQIDRESFRKAVNAANWKPTDELPDYERGTLANSYKVYTYAPGDVIGLGEGVTPVMVAPDDEEGFGLFAPVIYYVRRGEGVLDKYAFYQDEHGLFIQPTRAQVYNPENK